MSQNPTQERSLDMKKRKGGWRRPVFNFFKPFGGGYSPEGTDSSQTVSEVPEEDVREYWETLLAVLLDEKEKNLGSMIDEMSQLRIPSLRKVNTPPPSERVLRTQYSSTSSGESMMTYHRALERNDSSFLEREELIQSLKCANVNQRGASGTKQTSSIRPRRVESETSEYLPPVTPIQRPALQLQMDSMMSYAEPPYTETPSPSPIRTFAQPSMPMISYDELDVKDELGRGQFASVKFTLWKGVPVALKEWHTLTNRENMEMAFQEGGTLAVLRHPCVVSFYGMLNHGPSPGLVVEYLPHRSLKSKLKEWKGTEFETKRLKVAVALGAARGMEFLHSRKVIHFDLKCENLLCDLRDLENPIVKIGDVGLSKEKMKTFVSGNMRGTLPWMAPELFPSIDRRSTQGNITDLVNEKVDVYSFGVVLWEIWEMGEMPYPTLDPNQLLEGIFQGSLHLQCPAGCDPLWAEIMYDCIKRTPDQRPDFPTIISKLEKVINEDEIMHG